MPDTQKTRPVFYLSDRTGITTKTLGHALLTQFSNMQFEAFTLPFINSVEKATNAVRIINAAADKNGISGADKALCSVKEGKPDHWMGQTVSIDYYISTADEESCLFDDYCANFRTMTIMALRDSFYGDVMVTSVDEQVMQQSCYDLANGTHIGDGTCVNVVQ